jgi:predicted aspartyl protease
VGTFRVEVTVSNLGDRARRRTLALLVDTGSTYTTLPRDIVEAVGAEPTGTRRIRLGDGRLEEWPVTAVLVQLNAQEFPTICLVGPRGGPALLGAVTLEEAGLGVDPSGRRLVPVAGYLV